MTPEQLREQAAVNEEFAEASDREGLITDMRLGRQNAAALRAAADQLEAVRAFAGQADLIWNVKPRVSDRLNSILTLSFEDNA